MRPLIALVDAVQVAAQLFELMLLLCSGAGVFKLVVGLSDLLLCIFTAEEQFARDPADHICEGSDVKIIGYLWWPGQESNLRPSR